MRNSLEITRKYQFGYMLLRHLESVAFCFVIEMVVFSGLIIHPVAKYIIATVFTFGYACAMYGAASRLSSLDKKSYTPLEPSLKWGFLWGCVISAVLVLIMVIFRLNWIIYGSESGFNSLLPIIINLICCFLSSPYYGFFGTQNGMLPVYTIIIMITVPVAACAVGYYGGIKNTNILQKLDSLRFEKAEDE